jgi:mRNA-degrading endonuclease RelE of RelBE toxin-antitoxin system
MEFIEATIFSRLVYEYLSEDEYQGLQVFLLTNPESGSIIVGSGGMRKIRWRTQGKGKSGGVRIIYYYKKTDSEIWLLTIYRKNETESIPAHILKRIAKELEDG